MVMTEETVGASVDSLVEGTWVVGLDGSDCATNAMEWAAANAIGRATAIELVMAWQTPVVGVYPMASPVTMPIPSARQRSLAWPVASCSTAKLELMPAPVRKLRRTEVPDPLGATMMTSTSLGATTPVCFL